MIAEQKALIPVGINNKPIVINRFSILIFFAKIVILFKRAIYYQKNFIASVVRMDKKPW